MIIRVSLGWNGRHQDAPEDTKIAQKCDVSSLIMPSGVFKHSFFWMLVMNIQDLSSTENFWAAHFVQFAKFSTTNLLNMSYVSYFPRINGKFCDNIYLTCQGLVVSEISDWYIMKYDKSSKELNRKGEHIYRIYSANFQPLDIYTADNKNQPWFRAMSHSSLLSLIR